MTLRPMIGLLGVLGLVVVCGCRKSDQVTPPEPSRAPTEASAAAKETKEPFGRLTVDELVAKMAAAKAGQLKLAVFDNNGRDTFNEGHLPGATWVQYDEIKATDLPTDKDTTLVFYCYNEH